MKIEKDAAAEYTRAEVGLTKDLQAALDLAVKRQDFKEVQRISAILNSDRPGDTALARQGVDPAQLAAPETATLLKAVSAGQDAAQLVSGKTYFIRFDQRGGTQKWTFRADGGSAA